VRASVASVPFEQRNTTRRMSFAYRLLDRGSGNRLLTEPQTSAQSRSLVKLALICTIRCLLRLTMLVSRVAPPRVLSLKTCIPVQGRCLSLATSAYRLAAIPSAAH